MSEKASKKYEENEIKGSITVADQLIREPVNEFTKTEAQVKALGPRGRGDSAIGVNDSPSESIVKEYTLTKNDDVKLRITSDKEC